LKFLKPVKKDKPPVGRPEDPSLRDAFNKLCEFMEDNDECQYAIVDLRSKFRSFFDADDNDISSQYLKQKLGDHFGSRIVITSVPGGKSVLTFISNVSAVFNSAWYTNRASQCTDAQSERTRIIQAAVEVIAEDISTRIYDNESYSSLD